MLRQPEVSVVIPIFNEEAILRDSVRQLRAELDRADVSFEVLLAENGSTDRTSAIAKGMAEGCEQIRTFSIGEPNYGKALREGIMRARGCYVICEEIDLCDTAFHLRALEILGSRSVDMVVGSKAMSGSCDRRPWIRRFATRAYNGLLRVTLGFRGTDTHGLKAFRHDTLLPVVSQCVCEHDVYASELVIRANRARITVLEIPVDTEEKRLPSTGLLKRVPRVVKHLWRLWMAIHVTRPQVDTLPYVRAEE